MSNDKYIGQFLDNRYEILEKIGSGGMADVFKARCHRLNRLVAIKILKSDLAQDPDFRRRFHAESQAVAMLSQPNIVSVYDVSRTGDTEYIVMELIEGITLKQYINRKGVLNWKEALHFATQTAKALSHAHSRGIIHRDIKPHNIMILKDGSVKVADFGIAQLLSTQQNTLTQQALGSVHYISPEQAKGGHVDERSDIYSLGVVMYEMLTSRLPFEGESAVSVAIQHISSIPLMPREINPDIPAGLEQITMHAMEPNLDMRYASADEMLKNLEEFRKNPDIVFDYSGYTPSVSADPDETRVINGAVPAAPAVTHKPAAQTVLKPVKRQEKSYGRKKGDNRNRHRASFMIGLGSVAIIIILLVVFMWNYFVKGIIDPPQEHITVPRFVGQYIDAVEGNSEYLQDYTFDKEYQKTDDYQEGYIIQQDPPEGREMIKRQEGIKVKLTVAQSEDKVLMPQLLNKDYREASSQIKHLGLDLTVQLEPVYDDAVTKDYVIDQYPAAGEQLTDGSTIYITYSLGPEEHNVKVPNVTGLSESQAIARLKSYDLLYKVEYVDDDALKGKVIFQSYVAGETVPVKTEVVIQVSNGPVIVEPPVEEDPPVYILPPDDTEDPVDTDPDTGEITPGA